MAFAATLQREARSSDRHPVDLDGTLRDADRTPYDVTVHDMSRDGVRLTAATELAAGTGISIGLPGLGMRQALVMRAQDGEYGCRFHERLSAAELAAAIGAVANAPIPFPASALHDLQCQTALPVVRRLPGAARAALILGGAAATWALLLGARTLIG